MKRKLAMVLDACILVSCCGVRPGMEHVDDIPSRFGATARGSRASPGRASARNATRTFLSRRGPRRVIAAWCDLSAAVVVAILMNLEARGELPGEG